MLVTADDSTGAIEAGAACADVGWTVDAVPFAVAGSVPTRVECDCTVIDLRSRHVTQNEARARIVAATTSAHRVHKIDSTLRGNWSSELAALVDSGRRIVLIPAHPRTGRVCVGGVVYVNGVPVAQSELGNDPRLPVRSSRPSETLPGSELNGVQELESWLAASTWGVAIVDAATLPEIDQLVGLALGASDVLIAGPAPVVEAVAKACAPSDAARSSLPEPLLPGPIVVVCASLHPVSRIQIANVAAAGIDVATSSEIRVEEPGRVAIEVAARAHQLVADRQARSVVLVGGDTAEAFLGDAVVRVFGSIDVGVGVSEAVVRGRRLRIASKPGGFGTPNTLVDLVTR